MCTWHKQSISLHFTIYFLNSCTNSVADIKVKSCGVNREYKVKISFQRTNLPDSRSVLYFFFFFLGNFLRILTCNKMTGGQRGAQGHSPNSLFSLCFSDSSCNWVSSTVSWDREAQQCRRESTWEQERGCGGKVKRPACVLRLNAVLPYFNIEQSVCRNRQSCAGLTHNLVRDQQNIDISEQNHKVHKTLVKVWVKTVRGPFKYLPKMSADGQGHTEEVINQR